MTDTKVVSSGVTHAVEFMVTADQVTILGNGTTEDPLRSSGSENGVQVANDGVVVPGGPFDTLDFQGLISASDAGGGFAAVTIPRGINLLDDGVAVPDNPHNVLDFVGGGVDVTDVGGGRATIAIPQSKSILVWGVGEISLTSGFMQPGGAPVDLVATNVVRIPLPILNGTVESIVVRHNLAGTSGQTITYTVFLNAVSTSVAVAVPTGSTTVAANTTESFDVAQGDSLAIGVSVAGTPGANTVNAIVTVGIVPAIV